MVSLHNELSFLFVYHNFLFLFLSYDFSFINSHLPRSMNVEWVDRCGCESISVVFITQAQPHPYLHLHPLTHLINEIDSFKMEIYEKSERQENITQNDLDRLVKDAVARLVLEAKKIKLLNGKSIQVCEYGWV